MHYYQFNIADYRKDTQHLSPIEHYIYRELMDWYYLDERQIPKETQSVTRRLRLVSENNPEVKSVLQEFFTETDSGWSHGRIESEIGKYHAKADAARINGSKGGRPQKPKKTQPVNLANPEITQGKANHKPLTINHKPVKESRASPFTPPTIDDVTEYVNQKQYPVDPVRFVAYYESNGWRVGKNKMKCWKSAVTGWSTRNDQPNNPSGGNAAPKQTAAQRIAARRLELAGQSPDMGDLAADDRDVRAPLDEPAGGGAERHLASRTA